LKRMAHRSIARLVIALAGLAALAACAPVTQTVGPPVRASSLQGAFFITADGDHLPYRRWMPNPRTRAVILAVHGMNDYSRTFEAAATAWAKDGIATYTYDQRGFGGSFGRGIWPGADALVKDVKTMARLVHARHPGVPLYLLGSSMGGGVVLAAIDDPALNFVDGAVLLAPAVWGRELMSPGIRVAMWLAAHTVPEIQLTSADIKRIPTDNNAVLRQMAYDPRVIKYVRVDSLYGVSNLMDKALAAAPHVRVPVLILYGEKDQIVPKEPIVAAVDRMPKALRHVAIYPNGWHMLLHDKQAPVVYRDIAAWIADRQAMLPSGADRNGVQAIARRKD
jgi:acylglycerol lipase